MTGQMANKSDARDKPTLRFGLLQSAALTSALGTKPKVSTKRSADDNANHTRGRCHHGGRSPRMRRGVSFD